MAERQRTSVQASRTPWYQRRWVRWVVMVAYTGAVFGLGVAVWHWVRGKSWDDSLSFALTMTLSAVVVPWVGTAILWRAGRRER